MWVGLKFNYGSIMESFSVLIGGRKRRKFRKDDSNGNYYIGIAWLNFWYFTQLKRLWTLVHRCLYITLVPPDLKSIFESLLVISWLVMVSNPPRIFGLKKVSLLFFQFVFKVLFNFDTFFWLVVTVDYSPEKRFSPQVIGTFQLEFLIIPNPTKTHDHSHVGGTPPPTNSRHFLKSDQEH